MKINFLKIQDKRFEFHKKSNLITSDVNSVGKTTLIRSILYCLGYPIPFTRGFSFKNMEIQISINNKTINICRSDIKDENIKLVINNKQIFFLNPISEQTKILSFVYGIDEPKLLKSVLGLHYFDQEKGWTLLNRGKVIGGIGFYIEDYIEGLSNKKIDDINEDIKEKQQKKDIYNQINKIIQNREEYEEHDDNIDWNQIDDFNNEKRSIDIKIRRLKNKNKNLSDLHHDNEDLLNLMTSSNLYIKTDNGKEKITKSNLIFTEYKINEEMLKAQVSSNKEKISLLRKEKRKLQNKLNDKLELISIDDQIGRFGNAVSSMNISSDNIKSIMSDYGKDLYKLKEKRKKILQDNTISKDVYDRIISYSNILGVENSIDKSKDFIFTSDLKQYSGAKLHLLVFAFRMALLKEMQLSTNIIVPIILDSPLTGELDKNNLKKIFKLIKEEFYENQIIVASILNNEDDYNYEFSNEIVLKDMLLK